MAFTRLFLAFSLLLLSLLVIASAGDYGYDGIPADSPQPNPEGEAKPGYGSKPEGEEQLNYGAKPDVYKPKPEEKETPEYGTTPKPEEEENKSYYGTKPEENEELLPIGVEGLVLCKSGPNYYPIQGALAKVRCQALDEIGLERTLPICSAATDAKGYFFATLSSLTNVVDKSLNLKDCKAFLESSPLETCNVPTDVNKGISGAPLSDYRVLDQMHMKLYSVRPFFFTSAAQSVPENGY